MPHFTHLHVHTDYSLLDGAISLEKYVEFGKKNNFTALGISDHGNVFGGVQFFQAAQKAGIKPILGCEMYFTQDMRIKRQDDKYYHLIVIVQNERGYQNLCKLMHIAYTKGFYFKPRIDYAALQEHSEGLIITSACLGGHIPSLLMDKRETEAQERLAWFMQVFGPDRFYLEVQPPDQSEQDTLNQYLYDIAQRMGIGLVATGDCHYVDAQDREAHEVMLAIQTHHKMSDPQRFSFGDCRVHLRTQTEMLDVFSGYPEAVWNTGRIADQCTFTYQTGKLFFPEFQIPDASSPATYFTQICNQGLQDLIARGRIPADAYARYQERLDLEIQLIIQMGFVGYFLVVGDFIGWARSQRIPVGPGRGSAAGSLVAWALQITDIDPLKYNLLFERFLNPERVSMPDIDIDFCIEGRERVIQYVKQHYGADKVCQIITFGTMLAKGVIKDAARALDIPFEDANALTDLVPDQLKITLAQALEQEPRLRELKEKNPHINQLFTIAFKLEGLTRHASKHAAGIVISPAPIQEVLPVYIPPKTQDLVTQYAMTDLETLGFLKMDFLGLKNLTLIDRTVAALAQDRGISLDITNLPLDDAPTFALLCAGATSGVFQLESEGLKDTLRRLQPSKFEDIIAVNALYRPGPLGSGMVDDFIERRHGRQAIPYLFPELEPILHETYGVIVYQEQVMKIASAIGGYSLGESDILRRAMGKKKADVMAAQHKIFVERAVGRGFDAKKAGELFDLMAYFAGYGFNKSHSAAYALIAYQTAYLKANYAAPFMAALISLEVHDPEKMAFYLAEAHTMGIAILGPDINASASTFTATDAGIRFGLQGIKNLGQIALDSIIQERTLKGVYTSFADICLRTDNRVVNKRIIESLIYSGALDSLPGNRAQKLADMAQVLDQAHAIKEQQLTGQMGLFGPQEPTALTYDHVFTPMAEIPLVQKLEQEKEYVGIYLSSLPLDPYQEHAQWLDAVPLPTLIKNRPTHKVTLLGLLKSVREITTKKGTRMAFAVAHDGRAQAELVIFPKTYQRVEHLLKDTRPMVITGTLDTEKDSGCTIKVDTMVPVEELFACDALQEILLKVPAQALAHPTLLEELKHKLMPGKTPLRMVIAHPTGTYRVDLKQRCAFTQELTDFARQHDLSLSIVL